MLFILGFILLMAGFAMLVVGPIPFTKKWTLSGWISRLAGLIFVSFFPLFFGLRYYLKEHGWEEELSETAREAINWGLFALCALGGGFLIFYVGRPASPKRLRRPAARVAAEDIEDAPAADNAPPFVAPPPPAKKRSAKREQDPFDFS